MRKHYQTIITRCTYIHVVWHIFKHMYFNSFKWELNLICTIFVRALVFLLFFFHQSIGNFGWKNMCDIFSLCYGTTIQLCQTVADMVSICRFCFYVSQTHSLSLSLAHILYFFVSHESCAYFCIYILSVLYLFIHFLLSHSSAVYTCHILALWS